MTIDTGTTVWERTASRYALLLKALEMHSKVDNCLEEELYWDCMSVAITYYGRRIKVRDEIITIPPCEFCITYARYGKDPTNESSSKYEIIGMDCDACEYGAMMGICSPEDGSLSDWLNLVHFIDRKDVAGAIDAVKHVLDKIRSITAAQRSNTPLVSQGKGSWIRSEPAIEAVTNSTGGSANIFSAEVQSIRQHEALYYNEVTKFYVVLVKGGQVAPDKDRKTERKAFTEIRVRFSYKTGRQLKLTAGDRITFTGDLVNNRFFGLMFQNVRSVTKG
jgi:hypothetical protein